ncbi:MAG: hypothetical protein ACLTK0_07680 [Anaerovoracaceae bacterium]
MLRALGAEGLSFETIAGVNSSQPHGVPSEEDRRRRVSYHGSGACIKATAEYDQSCQ